MYIQVLSLLEPNQRLTFNEVARLGCARFDWYEGSDYEKRKKMARMLHASLNGHAQIIDASDGIKKIDTSEALELVNEKMILTGAVIAPNEKGNHVDDETAAKILEALQEKPSVNADVSHFSDDSSSVDHHGKEDTFSLRIWIAVASVLILTLGWLNRHNPNFVNLFLSPAKVSHVCGFDFDSEILDAHGNIKKGRFLSIRDEYGNSSTGILVALGFTSNLPYLILDTGKSKVPIFFPRMTQGNRPFLPDERQTSTFVYEGCSSNLNFEPIPLVRNNWGLQ